MTNTPISIGTLQGDPSISTDQVGVQQAVDKAKSAVQRLEEVVQSATTSQEAFHNGLTGVHEEIAASKLRLAEAFANLEAALAYIESQLGKK